MIQPQQLERWILFINSSLIVFSLPLAWLKWFWWRMNVVGDMVGILGGFPAGYVVWFGSDAVLSANIRSWLASWTGHNWNGLVPAFGNLARYPFWAGFGILFALGWFCILTATLLTRPEPLHILQRFYLTARPIGWWTPVRRTLKGHSDPAARNELRHDLVACGLGIFFYFSLTLTLFNLMGGHLLQGASLLVVTIASGILFARSAIARLRNLGSTSSTTALATEIHNQT